MPQYPDKKTGYFSRVLCPHCVWTAFLSIQGLGDRNALCDGVPVSPLQSLSCSAQEVVGTVLICKPITCGVTSGQVSRAYRKPSSSRKRSREVGCTQSQFLTWPHSVLKTSPRGRLSGGSALKAARPVLFIPHLQWSSPASLQGLPSGSLPLARGTGLDPQYSGRPRP